MNDSDTFCINCSHTTRSSTSTSLKEKMQVNRKIYFNKKNIWILSDAVIFLLKTINASTKLMFF